MKKDEDFKCKDCGKELREKSVTKALALLQLCPQCYAIKFCGKHDKVIKLGKGIRILERYLKTDIHKDKNATYADIDEVKSAIDWLKEIETNPLINKASEELKRKRGSE